MEKPFFCVFFSHVISYHLVIYYLISNRGMEYQLSLLFLSEFFIFYKAVGIGKDEARGVQVLVVFTEQLIYRHGSPLGMTYNQMTNRLCTLFIYLAT